MNVFSSFSGAVREETKSRLALLLASTQEESEGNKRMWAKREQYKNFIISKNAALKYLLDRSTEALSTIADGEDAGGKGKKKPAAKGKK